MPSELRVFSDRAALAVAAADEVVSVARASIASRGEFRIALAGGSTPEETYRRLAVLGEPTGPSSSRWHVFFGDERIVAKDSPDSNAGMASRAWLAASAIPKGNVHRADTAVTAVTAAAAADAYEADIKRVFQLRQDEMPVFDLILLGLGADGHTASLFPGSPALLETQRLVAATRSPKSPVDRVTLTLPVVNAARSVVFLVTGKDKAATLARVRAESSQAGMPADRLPASRVRPTSGTLVVFADAAAAAADAAPHATMPRAMATSTTGTPSTPASRDGDDALLAALRRGDDAAYERLVRQEGPRLLAVIRRLVANEDDARDVLQETFVSAWKAIGQFHGESRLSTWLHRIAVNAALMRLRSKKSRPERPIDDLLPQFAEDGHFAKSPIAWDGRADTRLEDRETLATVRKAIESLPETYRTVLVLRDVEGLSTEETASILGVTQNAVKVRLHRAHLALRALLDAQFRSPPAGAQPGISSRGRPTP